MTDGHWELRQFAQPGTNGLCHMLGKFANYRDAVEAARSFVKFSTLAGGFSCTFEPPPGSPLPRSNRRVSIEPPRHYDPDVEVVLPNGEVVWLGDLMPLLPQ